MTQAQPLTHPFLEVEDCSVVFGGLKAVQDVTFAIDRGAMTGLIGPNGAGKTTLFNLATGVYTPTAGRIRFLGQQIAGPAKSLGRRDIARAGICRTFQNIRLFGGLSVLDNVLIGANWKMRQSLFSAAFRTRSFYSAEKNAREHAFKILSMLGLESYASWISSSLPYGAQRRLEIARALATQPQFLLLDEPAAGMNPHESMELVETIRWIRSSFDLTILLIEHDMRVVMGLCERVLVLVDGALVADGTPAEVRSNPRVIEAYLGEAD